MSTYLLSVEFVVGVSRLATGKVHRSSDVDDFIDVSHF
jgi:hypothetical protein